MGRRPDACHTHLLTAVRQPASCCPSSRRLKARWRCDLLLIFWTLSLSLCFYLLHPPTSLHSLVFLSFLVMLPRSPSPPPLCHVQAARQPLLCRSAPCGGETRRSLNPGRQAEAPASLGDGEQITWRSRHSWRDLRAEQLRLGLLALCHKKWKRRERLQDLGKNQSCHGSTRILNERMSILWSRPFCFHKIKNVFSEIMVTLNFDLWPPTSNEFPLESDSTFAPNLKEFPLRCSGDVVFTRMRGTKNRKT